MLPSPMNPMRAMRSSLILRESLKRLDQISNQVGARGCVWNPGERHAVAGDHRLRVRDERIDRLLRPHDAAALQCRRIAKVGSLPGLAAEHAMQVRANALLAFLERMARDALLEPLLAAPRISVRTRKPRRRDQQRGRHAHRLHAATSGAGFFTYFLIASAVQ